MEGGSLIDMEDVEMHPALRNQPATVQQPRTAATDVDPQSKAADDLFHDFFTMSTDSIGQQAPPTTLVASPSSPGTQQTVSATISPSADDPQAGFGSPAPVAPEEQSGQSLRDTNKSVQQHLLHQYSHLHGRLDQLPFEHLQEVQQQAQQQHVPLQASQFSAPDNTQQQQPTSTHQKPQHQATSSVAGTLLPVCARVNTLSQLLQQHGATQGEANANIRLLLATISAKQVKTRQLVASLSLSSSSTSSLQQQEHMQQEHEQLQQQIKQLTEQLAATRSELVAARSEVAQARASEVKQAELLQSREQELSELKDSMIHSESGYHTEISNLQERLLEAEGQLAQLSAELPGGRRKSNELLGSTATAALTTATSRSSEGFLDSRDVQSAMPEVTALEATIDGAISSSPSGGPFDSPMRQAPHTGLPVSPSLTLLTPDQAAAAQLKGWLRESQAALIEAQEDLMEREREIKQLKHQLQQLTHQQQQQQQQEGPQQQEEEDSQAPAEVSMLYVGQSLQQGGQEVASMQQQRSEELRSDVEEAPAAADACSERDSLRVELHALQAELSELREQSVVLTAARDEALLLLEQTQRIVQRLQQEKQQSDASGNLAGQLAAVDQKSGAEDDAAAERLEAAERELKEARETAAAALAEVAQLQQQLQQSQQHQQATAADLPATQDAAGSPLSQATEGEAAGITAGSDTEQPQQGSLPYQLLLTTSQNQALQAELADTKQRLLLLLKLVKKAAAAVTAAGTTGEALQLPAELKELVPDTTAAASTAAAEDGVDDDADVASLLQLVTGLEQRYCSIAEQQQLLMRSREMQFLLENALQQVHMIKTAGKSVGCSCPSEQEYQQLAAKDAAANCNASETASGSVAPMHGVVQEPVEHPAAAAAGQALPQKVRFAAAEDDLLAGLEQYGPPSQANAAAAVPASPPATAAAVSQGLVSQDPWSPITAAGIPSSCSSGARVGYSGGAGAGSQIGFTVVDEGLGYDGFDGSWWAKSSIGNTTTDDLPSFLIPKSG